MWWLTPCILNSPRALKGMNALILIVFSEKKTNKKYWKPKPPFFFSLKPETWTKKVEAKPSQQSHWVKDFVSYLCPVRFCLVLFLWRLTCSGTLWMQINCKQRGTWMKWLLKDKLHLHAWDLGVDLDKNSNCFRHKYARQTQRNVILHEWHETLINTEWEVESYTG